MSDARGWIVCDVDTRLWIRRLALCLGRVGVGIGGYEGEKHRRASWGCSLRIQAPQLGSTVIRMEKGCNWVSHAERVHKSRTALGPGETFLQAAVPGPAVLLRKAGPRRPVL